MLPRTRFQQSAINGILSHFSIQVIWFSYLKHEDGGKILARGESYWKARHPSPAFTRLLLAMIFFLFCHHLGQRKDSSSLQQIEVGETRSGVPVACLMEGKYSSLNHLKASNASGNTQITPPEISFLLVALPFPLYILTSNAGN